MQILLRSVILISLALFVFACGDDNSSTAETPQETVSAPKVKPVPIPPFNKDSAYAFVAKQVSIGTREPGSKGIEECREWMISMLKKYDAEVHEQKFNATYYSGETHPGVNIIGKINPSHKNRVILAAHYDTRFIAEQDSDPTRQNDPILGADDGGSGVGILMEIARIISENPIDLGVDLIFFDAEDQGKRGGGIETRDTWCIGSQYWSKNPHESGYDAKFGILLDMVGAENATFSRENVKGVYRNATELTELYQKVWALARAMKKGSYFQNRIAGGITDDHYFVNTFAGITMIDIINRPMVSESGFGPHWHTHNDNIDIISPSTLGAVGQVVTAVIYKESTGAF